MAITNNVVGTNIDISDSNGDRIIDLGLQGDTVQDGTPTPDAPIEVQTVTGRQVINVSGTNLLRNSLEILKTNNIGGTWNDNVYTQNGVSFTYNDDGSITVTGTASANTYFYISRNTPYEITMLPAGTYYFTSHEYTGANDTWKMQFNTGSAINVFGTGSSKEQHRTLIEDINTTASIVVYSGKNPNGAKFYPMIAKESGIDYEQYKVQTCEINLGKNLYKPFSYTRTSQGVEYTYNEDGTITASGTATGTSSISITRADAYDNGWYYSLSPGTYTLSGGIDNTKRLQVITADTGTSVASTGASGTTTFTINNYTIVYLRVSITNGTTVDSTFYPQIEKGSEATSWSAYKKPIKLCKSGTTFVDKIIKSSGKNLFNPYNLNLERNGITATYDADTQTFTFNGTCTANNTTFRIADNDIQFIKGKTRSISYWQGGSVSGYCYLRHYDENYASSCNCDISTLSSSNPTKYATSQSTFISPSTRTGIRFNNGSVADNFKIKIMVYDITNQTQDYEPYGNSWYIARQTFIIDKDNLDDMTVTKRNDGDGTNTITFNINGTGGFTLGSSADWLSNYFPRSQTSTSGIEGYGSDGQRFRAFLQINRSRLNSLDVAGFKEYYKSKGVELYCTINGTTVYEPITDAELINQLNNAATMVLPYKNAYITSSSENLPAILDIDYFTQDRYIRESDRQALIDGIATIPYKINVIKNGSIIKTLDQRSIVNIDYEDYRYVDTSSLVIGQFVARKITGSLDKIYTDFEIEDTELNIQMGVQVNNTTNYYDLGNFLVTKPTNNNVKDKTNFETMDYTKKFNVVFDGTRLTYPCTAQDLAVECCRQAGVELATHIFTNCEFVIEDNQYVENETCRKVMQDIGKLAYSWVRIDWDNKCYIDFDPQDYILDENKITNHNYYDLSLQNNVFGPVNRVVLGMENVEGENVVIEDSESIAANGVTEIQLYDSNITYTEALRQQAIVNATKLFGLTFTPLDTNTTGHPWLIGKEKIQVTTMDGTTVYTYPFDRTIAYMGHIKTKLTSKAETKTETEYKNKATLENSVRQTRIIVDKQNGKINLAVTTANTAKSTANTAQSTANTAKSTATNTQNNLNTLINTTLPQTYYTKSEIDMSEGEITAMVSRETSRGSIVSKINLVPGEIALEGTVTANNNFKVLTDGSIEAKNGSFSGDIFLGSGGKVIGGDGLLTNLQFQSVGIIDGWSPLGFNIDDRNNVLYQDLAIDYNIPSNFTIKEATLTLYCTKVMTQYWNPSTGQSTDTTGVPKKLRLFKGVNNQTHQVFWGNGTSYFYRNDLSVGSVISNAFGSSEYSPSISSVGQVVAKTTIDLKNSLATSSGNNSLVVRTNVTKPANFNTATNRQTIAESTGMARAVLNIIGYMSTSA